MSARQIPLRRPHLRPRKGTNLGAGNPSPASCSASSRCQPCAPLARLKKYCLPLRANPSTSTLPQDGACQREALGARSALISHLAKQGQGEVDGGEVRHGRRLLPFSAIAACINSAIAFACALPPSEPLSCRCIRGATRFTGVVAGCHLPNAITTNSRLCSLAAVSASIVLD